jgi:hypothetical protein
MRIFDYLPLLSECIGRWEKAPSYEQFFEQYYSQLNPEVAFTFSGPGLYVALQELDWKAYRKLVLRLDPKKELERLEKQLHAVQDFFPGIALEGEVILFGSFETMDGYARFERGKHRVFLGVDESFEKDSYLDVLMAHELTHVVRESRPEVWEGFGLKLDMNHDQFTENLPVIEHLFSEGFSCAVSEILVPTKNTWQYSYQEERDVAFVLKHAKGLNSRIHEEIRKDQIGSGGDYSSLYWTSRYVPQMPDFSHYYWAWQWVKQVIQDFGVGDARKVVSISSKDFVEHALAFHLK